MYNNSEEQQEGADMRDEQGNQKEVDGGRTPVRDHRIVV